MELDLVVVVEETIRDRGIINVFGEIILIAAAEMGVGGRG